MKVGTRPQQDIVFSAGEAAEREALMNGEGRYNASAGFKRRACSCLPWADVYRRGVKCGQGMEFYAWLGNKEALKEDDPQLAEVRYNIGDEFCEKFFKRMETNRAVAMKFNTPPSENKKEWDRSWCYVSPECGPEDLHGGGYVPNKPVHWKISQGTHEDVVLRDMQPDAVMRVARNENDHEGYDLGVLAGFAYYLSMGEDPDSISETMLKDAASTGLPTILQPANHLATRLIVKGVQHWQFHQNTGHQRQSDPGSWWTGFKIEEW